MIGSTLSDFEAVSVAQAAGFATAFVGAAALWWVYFDRSADAAATAVAQAEDPGALGRSAYHLIHPLMVAGIIVTAAGDQRLLSDPTAPADAPTIWLMLGGTVLFLIGHAAFKATVWRVVPWSRLIAVLALVVLGLGAASRSALALGVAADLVLVVLVVADRRLAVPVG